MNSLRLAIVNNKHRLPTNSANLGGIILGIGGLLFAVLLGLVAATGNRLLVLPFGALFGAMFVIAMPVTWTLWLLYIAGFLVIGPIVYFSGFSQLNWVPALMGAVMLLQVIMHGLRQSGGPGEGGIVPMFVYLIASWLMLAVFSTLIDNPTLEETLNASRFYFFMWPVMLVFMYGLVKPDMMYRLWKAFLVIALLQVPLVLYQFFVVAKRSLRSAAWDAVIGTFPGREDGGGQSAAMALFLLLVMLLGIALWRAGRLKGTYLGVLVASGLGSLALAEVKAAVLMLPIVVGIYFRKEIARRPMESIVFIIGAVLMVLVLFAGYEKFHYSETRYGPLADYRPESSLDRVKYALDPDRASHHGHIGRVTQLIRWWEYTVGHGDYRHALLGYGIGSTQVTRIGVGELVNRFPYRLDVSSSSILLWETGLVGHMLFMIMLLAGAKTSARLAVNPNMAEEHRILLRIGAIGLFLLALTLP